MSETEKDIIRFLRSNPGLSDRELAEGIKGRGRTAHYINQQCRMLASKKVLVREKREDGLIGNRLTERYLLSNPVDVDLSSPASNEISEKRMKQVLESYLKANKWEARIAWGVKPGVDIEATNGARRWIIEVKGSGAYNPQRSELFLSVLGETLQRMDDLDCKYSVALPDMDQFHRLWDRLPALAKNRTGITALFVDLKGKVTEK